MVISWGCNVVISEIVSYGAWACVLRLGIVAQDMAIIT